MWAAYTVEIIGALAMILGICIVGGVYDEDKQIPWTKFIIGFMAGIIGGITGYIIGR